MLTLSRIYFQHHPSLTSFSFKSFSSFQFSLSRFTVEKTSQQAVAFQKRKQNNHKTILPLKTQIKKTREQKKNQVAGISENIQAQNLV
jgi:hypothetical protein